MSGFKEVPPENFRPNPFALGTEWMLIAAERAGRVNAMTAGWGGYGVMWSRNVVYAVIRPERHTREFVDAAADFSLTFFPPSRKSMLQYFGTVSGRDEDKVAKAGLTVLHDDGVPYFSEADTAILCRKLYVQRFDPACFLPSAGELDRKWYPEKDYHWLYIAEVKRILAKE